MTLLPRADLASGSVTVGTVRCSQILHTKSGDPGRRSATRAEDEHMIDPVAAPTPRKAVVTSAGGIVASQSRRAASVGAEVLAAGGNAVDAAVATSFAVGVLEPWMSGIGGGGYLVVAAADGTPPQVIDCSMVA